LDSIFWFGIIPFKCILQACDDAGSALKASIRVRPNIAVWVKRVDFRRANVKAILTHALEPAYVRLYFYVPFFVDFEHVFSELFFYFQSCHH